MSSVELLASQHGLLADGAQRVWLVVPQQVGADALVLGAVAPLLSGATLLVHYSAASLASAGGHQLRAATWVG